MQLSLFLCQLHGFLVIFPMVSFSSRSYVFLMTENMSRKNYMNILLILKK